MDLYLHGGGFGVPGGVLDGKRIGSVFLGRDIDAAGERWPDGVGQRFNAYGFGVGDAITELGGFTATDNAGAGVKIQDFKILAPQLLNGAEV